MSPATQSVPPYDSPASFARSCYDLRVSSSSGRRTADSAPGRLKRFPCCHYNACLPPQCTKFEDVAMFHGHNKTCMRTLLAQCSRRRNTAMSSGVAARGGSSEVPDGGAGSSAALQQLLRSHQPLLQQQQPPIRLLQQLALPSSSMGVQHHHQQPPQQQQQLPPHPWRLHNMPPAATTTPPTLPFDILPRHDAPADWMQHGMPFLPLPTAPVFAEQQQQQQHDGIFAASSGGGCAARPIAERATQHDDEVPAASSNSHCTAGSSYFCMHDYYYPPTTRPRTSPAALDAAERANRPPRTHGVHHQATAGDALTWFAPAHVRGTGG